MHVTSLFSAFKQINLPGAKKKSDFEILWFIYFAVISWNKLKIPWFISKTKNN